MADFPDVRRARQEDQQRIGALWLDLLTSQSELDPRFTVADDAISRWHNDFSMWLSDETQCIFVVEPEQTVEGFVTAHRWVPPPIYGPSSEVYIAELYVAPDVRRQGYGTQLVQAVRHWAESLSADRLRLQMMTANTAAQAFWKQQEAQPFTTTMTVELEGGDQSHEPRRRIGF